MTPPENRRQRKKQAQATAIVGVAMELFEQQGFEKTTMEQIAEQADVAKATLYKYFPAKEAIVSEYWRRMVGQFHAGIEELFQQLPDTQGRLAYVLKQSMEHIMSHREIYLIYIRYRMQHLFDREVNEKLRSGSQELFTAIIKAGQEQGEIREDMSATLLAVNFEFIALTQYVIWLSYPDLFDLEKSTQQLVNLYLQGAEK